jgi:protein TonB
LDTRLSRSLAPEPESRFGRSLALSLGLHGAAFGTAMLALDLSVGVPDGGPSVAVLVAQAEALSEWTLEVSPESVPREVELPELPPAELVPVDVPVEATQVRPAPEEALAAAPVFDWAAASADAEPLARIERRPQAVQAQPAPATAVAPVAVAAAAAEPAVPLAPRGVERPPRLIAGPPPTYPRVALRLQQQGSVLLELEVDATGRVAAVRVVESSGFERLDEAARDGVLAWRFEPALRDGAPVAKTFRHRIQFVLEG